MPLADGYYVVGVFEDFRLDVFPTHVPPIVAQYGAEGYRRWNYQITAPYEIQLLEPVGEYRSAPEKLFPVFTYRACEPKKFSTTCQVIALSPTDIVVETSRVRIVATLLLAAIRNVRNRRYRARAWRTMVNAFA
jgi:hypothetical protein